MRLPICVREWYRWCRKPSPAPGGEPKFMRCIPFSALALLGAMTAALAPAFAPARAQTGWQPVERIATYPVSGASGIALYEAIGAHGPRVGGSRAIAHTDFALLWTRDYRPQPDGSCVIAVARPSLVITYTLPEASGLSGDLARRWRVFRAGLEEHERVHGRHVVEMTEKIRAFSLGLSAPDDPECTRVRAKLQDFLAGVAAERRARAITFDREEMSEGGNVHRLILDLVNPAP